ncbi:MAG: hypothetical protein FD180_273 [Planctomycetota bacterium]|nr:MAG: hypothetical protein FD180_273 [Planctomycetota bacterium]
MIPPGTGTSALDAAIANHFPGVAPGIAFPVGDVKPFAGVRIFRDPQCRFWFYMTYGISDLVEKMGNHPALSGRGYEFTMRVPFEAEAPVWVAPFLGELTRILKPKGTSLCDSEPVLLGRPLTTMEPTRLDAVFFTADIQLGHGIDTPNGYVSFLQVVGIDAIEAAVLSFTPGTTLPLLRKLGPGNPFFMTILDRKSVLPQTQ